MSMHCLVFFTSCHKWKHETSFAIVQPFRHKGLEGFVKKVSCHAVASIRLTSDFYIGSGAWLRTLHGDPQSMAAGDTSGS